MRDRIAKGLEALGIAPPPGAADKLAETYGFELWGAGDEEFQPVRLVCSWATKEEDVAAFLADLAKLV